MDSEGFEVGRSGREFIISMEYQRYCLRGALELGIGYGVLLQR